MPREREKQALGELHEQAEHDTERTNLDGHWSARLASKDVGVTDRYQRTASGSHTFEAADILAEYQQLKNDLSPPYTVRLLYSPDVFGTDPSGRKFWDTFAVDDFGSEESVEKFCRQAFPGLTKNERDNQCVPRHLGP